MTTAGIACSDSSTGGPTADAGVDSSVSVIDAGVTPVSLDLTPPVLSLAEGTSSKVKAVLTLSDKTTKDVTSSVTWATSDAAVATAAAGEVRGLVAGTASIHVAFDAIRKTLPVAVTAATLVSLELTPTAPSLPKGLTKALVATGTFSDKTTQDLTTQVTWSSAQTTVAAVDAAGIVTGTGVGKADIKATSGAITATTPVTITDAQLLSIALTPTAPTVAKGFTSQLTATGTFTDKSTQDISTQAAWSSSNAAIATVGGATGLVSGLGVGSATITATLKGVTGTTTVAVSDAQLVSIEVTPVAPTVAKGLKRQFTATGVYSDATTQDLTKQVTWMSATAATATISNAASFNGLATTLDIGTTVITATSGAITSAPTTLTVSPAELVSIGVTPAATTLAKGLTLQFVAAGVYTDASTQTVTTQVTWSSTVAATATISNAAGSNGLATTLAEGRTTIVATSGLISGSTTLDVSGAPLVSIAVTPTDPSVALGTTQQFTAIGTYGDASTQDLTETVTWVSSTEGTATVSNAAGSRGLARGVGVGTTSISATSGAISSSTTLTVSPATLASIAVTPANPTIAAGTTPQFTAVGTYTDATTQDLTATVTWASSTPATATVSNAAGTKGVATGVAAGTTTISATSGAISGSTPLTVSACHVTINEVAVVGPGGASDEYVEVYNGCAFPIELKNWKLVYRAATGATDTSLIAAVSTLFAPGDFRLYVGSGYVGAEAGDATMSNGLSATGGGLALRDGSGVARASMGYGNATNAFVNGTAATVPPSGSSASRFPADGTDTSNDANDFHVVARTPRKPNL